MHHLCRFVETLPLYERSLRISEEALGPEHPDIATTLNVIAGLLERQGRYVEADQLSPSESPSREHVYVASFWSNGLELSKNNLSKTLRGSCRYKEALPLYDRSLRIFEKAFGPDQPDVATTLSGMAGLLRTLGRCVEASGGTFHLLREGSGSEQLYFSSRRRKNGNFRGLKRLATLLQVH